MPSGMRSSGGEVISQGAKQIEFLPLEKQIEPNSPIELPMQHNEVTTSTQNSVAIHAEAITDAPVSLDAILQGMNSANSELWIQAMRAARRLATTAPEQLLELTRKEAAFYRARTIQGSVISIALVGFIASFVIVSGHPEFYYLLAGSAMAAAAWLSGYLPRRARQSMIDVLETMNDPQFLGAVLSMLIPDGVTDVKATITLNSQTRLFVVRVLLEMLPNVRAEHKALLTREQMQALMALLKQSHRDPHLVVPILRALQHLGDENTIPALQTLTRSSNDIIQAAAEECVAYLSLRADQKRLANTLLRASDSVVNGNPETLLRAASGSDNTDPAELLRSSHTTAP